MAGYESWSTQDLISRIKDLESRCETDGKDHGHVSSNIVRGSRSEPKQKKIKVQSSKRKFDFDKYQQKYVAFKFAYLGWHYNGLVTQDMPTELPTVEEEIFKALIKTHLISHPDECRFSRCGRTDKGVSAMGQVMALNVRSAFLKDRPSGEADATTKELAWLEQLNGCLPPSIRILAYDDQIAPTFDARFSCRKRHYKYLLAPRVPGAAALNRDAMNVACSYLVGDHDFRNFCKLDASKQISNFHRTILRCEISDLIPPQSDTLADSSLGLYVLDLEGTAFLWHQVRCITAILLLVGQGLEEPEVVRELLDISKTPTKPIYEMADDWPLTLYDCDFGDQVNWKHSVQSQRIFERTFATLHEARIKDAISSFMVDAAAISVNQEATKPGTNLGDGRIKVQANYVPLMQRKRMADVVTLNAAFAEKKERKMVEKRRLEVDPDVHMATT
ncbi:protein of unknown function [Taphrina deformans PYCC 5710]|uniref:tRNA pseudouridine synthase n=1 Tax=Taphrina deformans (strain PYCC 5710 / ATCC 11124 / CBS 356.35 / IMI 108563 / JCM 9778 / NBRC 8474) TaxID=1097556 RepID=R4XHC6_TAPDE|nr:protein of unknown function [Taphrina deformans PYCC 5710]|eukprot:CCG83933.1 protein of unknown function [Taphrina deformans PYCC 5710]